eukprot:gene18633-22453_t
MKREYNKELSVKRLFDSPILAHLAKEMESQNETVFPNIVVTSRRGLVPLSFSQQRLWFIEHFLKGTSLYHIPLYMKITGSLNKEALKKSLDHLVVRHESLRTKLVMVSGIGYQEIQNPFCGFDFDCKISHSNEETEGFLQDVFLKTFDFDNETL